MTANPQTAPHPFSKNYSSDEDHHTIQQALEGNRDALDQLVRKHQPYIYNIVWKMVLSPFDAEDITQDILIKVVAALPQFDRRSAFRTWLYRIVVNHVISLKRRPLEEVVTSFDQYFDQLDQMPDEALSEEEHREWEQTIRDVSISCTGGMLLCLDRDQRMLIVLGDIFGIDHQVGAAIFQITPANFRQRLARARKDLYSWMNNRCGLVNKDNPCRCAKKTKAFIAAGFVDPSSLNFNSNYKATLAEINASPTEDKCTQVERLHREIFLDGPFKKGLSPEEIAQRILNDEIIKHHYRL